MSRSIKRSDGCVFASIAEAARAIARPGAGAAVMTDRIRLWCDSGALGRGFHWSWHRERVASHHKRVMEPTLDGSRK